MCPKILLVDDDRINLKNLAYFFRTEGYDVDTASNGTEATRLLETNEYDLLLSDIIMPGINGFDLLERVRSHAPGLPVFLMSGAVDLDENLMLNCGATDFIEKPLELNDLLCRIRRILKQPLDSASQRAAKTRQLAISEIDTDH